MTPLSAAILLVVVFVALAYTLYEQRATSPAAPSETEQVEQSEKTSSDAKPQSSPRVKKKDAAGKGGKASTSMPTASSSTSTSAQSKSKQPASLSGFEDICYESDAVPVLTSAVSSILIDHTAYRLSFNADFKVPNWVFYELTIGETRGNMKRSNNFQPDPALPTSQASQLTDYRNSGYDRGHMAPSADMNWDATVEDESYFLSNMCPQGHDFNAGTWLDLENKVRRWAVSDSAICVACGPVLPRVAPPAEGSLSARRSYVDPVTGRGTRITTIGKGKVLVPEWFYKVVLSPFGKHPKAIGFLMPNRNEKKANGRGNRPIGEYAVSVDSIERLTGIDFFPVLPDEVEDVIEASFDLKAWGL